MSRIFAGVVLVFGAACASHNAASHPVEKLQSPTVTADPATYAPYLQAGTARITGQAFYKTRDGDTKLAASERVYLDPLTPYSTAWFEKYGRLADYIREAPADRQFAAARKVVTTDGEGHFAFAGLPAGRYYIRTSVRWNAVGHDWQTEVLADSVDVASGQTKTLTLTSK